VVVEPGAPEVTTEETAEALAAGGLLIDVREQDEFETVRVPQARLIPLATVLDRRSELPRDQRVHVICAVGGRSLAAAAALRQLGFDAVSVAGGTQRWYLEGRPTVSGPQLP